MERWAGKIAIVTGASSGIGAALSVRLANHGLIVIGMARRQNLIDEVAKKVTGKGKIHSKQVDLSNSKAIREAFQWVEDKFGGADILINNAAYLPHGYITDEGDQLVDDSAIELTIDVNIKGLVLCTRLALSNMRKRDVAGHIVNINSVVGHYVPIARHMNVYPMTKSAVTSFTTALTNELAEFKSKVKVTSLSPGSVDTDMPPEEMVDVPKLDAEDIVDAIVYVLATPPSVNIYELGIKIVGEGFL